MQLETAATKGLTVLFHLTIISIGMEQLIKILTTHSTCNYKMVNVQVCGKIIFSSYHGFLRPHS
jgi:hypothetical protein